jgi:hypothetical protein
MRRGCSDTGVEESLTLSCGVGLFLSLHDRLYVHQAALVGTACAFLVG